MLQRKILIGVFTLSTILYSSCSNQKNTKTTRWYHSVNTRYNIHFNADEAYKDALKSKTEGYKDNLSEMIVMYPFLDEEEAEKKKDPGGPFDITIDKSTKGIKLHSIQVKPERDPGKRGNQKYQEWLKQREFNPFLKNSWLLMAKAEYQNNDYLKSISTFSYVSRLYRTDVEVVTEARLWMALAYTQMGWFYEADNIFHQIELAGGVPKKHKNLFSEVYANYLIRNQEYEKSVPYLEQAIKSGSGIQKTRLKYLLAQIYGHLGNKEKAYQAFGKVSTLNTPYEYEFNAKIQQVAFVNDRDKPKVISMLNRMVGNSKNKEYLDQVYGTLGNLYLQDEDTVKAVENYKLAIEKSTRGGYDKALSEITLGDIYFAQRDYVEAHPCYSGALGSLTKKHEAYRRVALRADVLGELVVHVEAVHLQDSLQHLARLPEAERLEVVNKLIENIKKQEELERKLAEREANMDRDTDEPFMGRPTGGRPSTIPTMPIPPGALGSTFYFYNPQTVSQGKLSFQQRWGTRKLEDDWRRREKRVSTFDTNPTFAENEEGETQAGDSVQVEQTLVTDIHKPEYYLQQLPLTPEAVTESNVIIEDALFNMGGIYKDKLEDYVLAIDAYGTDIRRFPQTPNLEEIYYQLFLIYSRMGNKSMADVYKNKLIAEFAKGDYATTLSDPNYEWNLRNMGALQDSIYNKTYEAYLASNTRQVRNSFVEVKEKFPVSPLMPKFMFLNSLTYAQTNEPKKMQESLKELVEKYPNSDVAPMASEILKGLLAGRPLALDGGPARGMVWDIRFGDGMAEVDSLLKFTDNKDAEYQLLLLFSKSVDKNQLIYDVANYNFSTFVLRTFDLDFSVAGDHEVLQVKGLKSFAEMKEYIQKAFVDSSLISKIDPQVLLVPMSTENYNVLMRGKTLNEYFGFFVENYGSQFPKLLALWNKQVNGQQKELKEAAERPKEVEAEKVDDPVVEPIMEEITDQQRKEAEQVGVVKPVIEEAKTKQKGGVELKASDAFSDEQVKVIDQIGGAATEIIKDPVSGVKNLLEKRKSRIKLTKEEREALKAEDDERKRLEKEQKAIDKAKQDSIKAIEDAKQQAIKDAEKAKADEIKAKADAEKAKEQEKIDAVQNAKKAKEDARKQRQEELKAKEKAQKEKLKQKEKERNERLKQREEERKEKARMANEKRKK